jgi:iron(III) transport system substrate-binding protein
MMMSNGRVLRLWSLLAAVALVLAACGGDEEPAAEPTPEPEQPGDDPEPAPDSDDGQEEEQADELGELIAAAEAEGRLTWYSSQEEATNQATADAFQEAYGIQVNWFRAASGPLTQRFVAEEEAGNHQADVFNVADESFFRGVEGTGMFEPLDELGIPALANYPAEFRSEEFTTISISPLVFGYHTGMVSEDELPDSWDDLLEPHWDGRLMLVDGRNVPTFLGLYWHWLDWYGENFVTELFQERGHTIVDSSVSGSQQLAAGAQPGILPVLRGLILPLQAEGAPVEYLVFDQTTGVEMLAAVSANAPNPNAARLFYHWLISEEGQAAFVGTQEASSVLPNVPGAVDLPSGYEPQNLAGVQADRQRLFDLMGVVE